MGASAHVTAQLLGEFARVDPQKTEVLAALVRAHAYTPIRRLLVVGCGSGVQTALLAQALRAEAVGIDLDGSFDSRAAAAVDLRQGDATRLAFKDGTFDLVFSYHVLEHVPEHLRAIAQMHRVLVPGGTCCVGTLNKQRLIGYLGSEDATTYEKIAWNLRDWKAMFLGQFRNELGAHAGFASEELSSALATAFDTPKEITRAYYDGVYAKHAPAVHWLGSSGLGRFLFPAVYFVARKQLAGRHAS